MKIRLLHPLISCICISKYRPQMLLKSLISFDQQSYPNKEIVISILDDDLESKLLVNKIVLLTDIRIKLITRSHIESIGVARNTAIANCDGEYICIWDDDDLYHYSRIADQHNLLQGRGKYFQASVIKQVILHNSYNSTSYLSAPGLWNGTLLCKKKHALQFLCDDSNNNECFGLIEFLVKKKLLYQMSDCAHLYTYVYHGTNCTNYFHFQYWTRQGELLEDEYSQSIRQSLSMNFSISSN